MNDTPITRRVLLHGTLVTVAAFALPSCLDPRNGVIRVAKDGDFFTADQLTVLNDIAETMIPRTDTPGAADAQVAAVIDKLMLTWAGEETKVRFPGLLNAFDRRSRATFGSPYIEVMPEERFAVVESFDHASFSDEPPDEAADYRKLKYLVFRVFYTSQEGSAPYVPVPGQYNGDLTLDEYEALIGERAYA